MADAAVETPQTAGAEKNVKLTEAANGSADKPTESNGDHKTAEKETSASNGDKKADQDDDFERYDNDKRDRRDRDDRRGDRRDDRKRRFSDDRGDRGRRDGGRGRGGRGGRGGNFRGGRGDRRGGRFDNNRGGRNNVKTRFERKDESSDATEIRRQVEFYFSDSNLPIDKFLLEETGGSENRPFPLKTIHNFKRMRHFQPFSAVVEAVKGSDFLEVNDKDEVYRKQPLDTKFTDDVKKNGEILTSGSMARSIYAKGFGEETGSTAFDIEEFFEPYGVRGVRLRRQEDGTFKGSVFVEFESEETAQQFLDMEEKPKYKDEDLLEVMSKKDYVDKKSQAILDGTVKPKSPTRRSSYHERRGGRDNGGYKRKRDYDDDDNVDRDNWRERRDKFQKGRRASPDYRSKDDDEKKEDVKTEEKDDEKTEKPVEEKADKPAEEKPAEEVKTEEVKAENDS